MSDLSRFSPEQRQVIESWGQGLAVTAGAGAGKTTTLVQKCVSLVERNPEARFAAVSFTEKSAAELRERLALQIPGGIRGHWVMTIHGLCGSILRENPRIAGFEGEEQMLSLPEQTAMWERACEALWHTELSEDVGQALDRMLERETRASVMKLLVRLRELELNNVLARLGETGQPDAQSLATLGQFVLERYARLKRRRGGLDFADLERGADFALSDERVRRDYHRRFDLVLVDEFQDTNPVQARILERFVRPDLSNLCIVGDPKQSIYRFRDADVSVFDDFCRRLPVRVSLTRNYRSRPGILDFANDVCAPLFEASGMEYEPLEPQRERAEEGSPVDRLEVGDPRELARFLVQQRDSGVPLESMALLLRKIRGNEKWLRALAAEGIPLAVASGGLFWGDPRVREMVALLRWWSQPLHRRSAAVFLRAPWVAMPDATLDAWFRTEGSLWQKFLEQEHGIAVALAPLRSRTVRPGEVLEALLSADPSGIIEGEIGSAWLGLWHRCEELSRDGYSFEEVVAELSHACDEGRREREVPPPANRGQLIVLTLHGSKGLEFDHVILVDFVPHARRRSDAPLLYWDRERGVLLAGRDEEGERLKKDPIEADWRAREDMLGLAEAKRLFYVALTRARERLVLVTLRAEPVEEQGEDEAPEKKSKKDPISPLDQDFWLAWIDGASDGAVTRCRAPEASPAKREAESPPLAPRPLNRAADFQVRAYRPRHSVTEWTRAEGAVFRPSALIDETEKEIVVPEEGAATRAISEMSPRELGTRVHAALETRDADALRMLEGEVGSRRFCAAPLLRWLTESPWSVLPAGAREWNELAFEVPVGNGETLVGSIDRLVRLPDGRFRLIDFKVVERDKAADELLLRYRDQLRLYVWALGRLEPSARGRCEAGLVVISPRGVQEVTVALEPPDQLDAWVSDTHLMLGASQRRLNPPSDPL